MNVTTKHARILGACLAFGFLKVAVSGQRMETSVPTPQPVTVESADVSTEVTGRIAVTTFDLVFWNPNSRVLEGTFIFPLLEGQQVLRFALDINGEMREAVPIEKEKGRVVFEDIERRGADPGLAEQTKGNIYRIRVYPLPAHGRRHVRFSYRQDLSPSDDQSTKYRLALDFPAALKHFRLAVKVHTGASIPAQVRTTLDLQLPPWRDGEYLELERNDFEARGIFELTLPKMEVPAVITGRASQNEYFYSEIPSTPILSTRATPKVVGLIWDSSGSGRSRDHDKEFALLDAWFTEIGTVEVHLVRLRDRATREGVFAVKGGNWKQLRKELDETIYDGATSLDGLSDDSEVDGWILFSDGVINYGTTPPTAKLPLHGPLHTVLSSPRADSLWLRSLAAQGNGEFVNLLETDPGKGAFMLESQSMRIVAIDYDPQEIAQVFPEVGTAVTHDSFFLSGVLKKKQARLRVLIGHNHADAQSTELTIVSGNNPSTLAPQAWASLKIESLSNTDPRANHLDIEETAREFGIVTANTSLLVLESARDYARYDIAPPGDLRKEWEELRSDAVHLEKKTAESHLESVVKAFNQRVSWWKGIPDKAGRSEVGPDTPGVAGPDVENQEEIILSPFVVASGNSRIANNSTLAGTPTREASPRESPESDRQTAKGKAQIVLQKWSPDAAYLEHLKRLKSDRRYLGYLEEREEHSREPGFYLDSADLFFEAGETTTALRILSNLAELEIDEPALLRVLGYRLMQANRGDLALPIFEQVLALRPEEPQSRRDLALACAATGSFQRAIDLLWEIVSRPWDARFPEIEIIAISELNSIVATCGAKLDVSRVDPRLLQNLPLDLRVVLTWDANDSDIDLWVTDPNRQTAKYDFPTTKQGGRLSRDFTGGYGPEEFDLHKATGGKYFVQINYYGDRRQNAFGPITAQVQLITGFGTPSQQEKRVTVRLKSEKNTIDIGSIDIAPPKAK